MSDEPETNESPEAVSEETSQADDLDSILSEWSEEPEEAKTPPKSPDDIVAEVEARLVAKQDYEKTVERFAKSCADLPFDVSPGVIEGWLNERARKDSMINSVYTSRSKKPQVWEKLQARLIEEFKGQFKTKEITEWTEKRDPSRLVNSASGGNFEMEGTKITGDIIDLHNYPDAKMPAPGIYGKDNILVLGEFGGLGLPVDGHVWQQKDNWGYQSFKNETELLAKYSQLMSRMEELIEAGLSAAVYTQTTDVEIETNGLMTYDRKIIKMKAAQLKPLHEKLYQVSVK